ncbi:hypothetical protein NPIL_584201 [Nephila pilipes]|uniref:Uncharacterized protein n=1 Tax=Nephila pilipes TaxID=299642 RepID=A0A8X6MMY6_NEPPI|nr:hypothetical protein NPIL_584201 [Nephila pilipes]
MADDKTADLLYSEKDKNGKKKKKQHRDTVLIWDVIPVERDKKTKGYSIDSEGSACCPARSICIMRFGSIIAIIRANNTKAVKSVLSRDGNQSNLGGNFWSLNVEK